MIEQYWEGSICSRVTKIDYRYDVHRMVRLIRDFIHEHENEEGFTSMTPDVFEGDLEAYVYSTFPMINVMVDFNIGKFFSITIDYNDINYRVDVSNKVFDVLRG